MIKWTSHEYQKLLSPISRVRFEKVRKNPKLFENIDELRNAIFDFIADFSNWDNAIQPDFLKTARLLTKAAHQALGGEKETNPFVLDPFAGGGSIPFEALRIGADVFASDLNPIPVLINKVLLEYIPKYGKRLAEEVISKGKWIEKEAKKELASLYPNNLENETPICYIWAKTIKCEAPNCGVEVPMLRSMWLVKGKDNATYFEISNRRVNGKPIVILEIKTGSPKNLHLSGTVKRGSVTCPVCGFTVSRQRVESIANNGSLVERMIAIVYVKRGQNGRTIKTPTEREIAVWKKSEKIILDFNQNYFGELSNIPDENLPYLRSIFNVHVYGVNKWAKLFNNRQLLSSITFAKLVRRLSDEIKGNHEVDFSKAVVSILALAVDRQINALNRTCYWNPSGPKMQAAFARQAIPMFWDYGEANPFGGSVGSLNSMIKCVLASFDAIDNPPGIGISAISSATQHPLPDDSADSIISDPPYYDAVPYADLSDFFYIWLKRMLINVHPDLFNSTLTPKKLEVVQLAERNPEYSFKTKDNFEHLMMVSLTEARRIAKPQSVSVFVFAHQSTTGWEAMLSALINAGWIVTASWPIDTEMPTRVRARNSAVLASSIHLVCRPREDEDGSLIQNQTGDWRDIQAELPKRIHDWMPRIAAEGIVGADAIFACIGPALEIFSRYTKVEKPNGNIVSLREYLEKVWAAVSQEAINMVFSGGEASSFEEDARITAMWLWTLTAGVNDIGDEESDEESEDDEGKSIVKQTRGFILEYDTARKIAQGLGVSLEDLRTLVEIKGETARLLPIVERAEKLFGASGMKQQLVKKKKKNVQLSISFEDNVKEEEMKYELTELRVEQTGKTVLDRLHQAMLLFSTGRTDALKRFLIEDGVGKEDRFWKLAQSLTALYPKDTDERRWVEAVQTYKKSLGF